MTRSRFSARSLLTMLGLAFTGVITPTAAAQSPAASWKVPLADWTFYAVPDAKPGAVTHFLALADSGLTTGDNLTAVWLERNASGVWTSFTWPKPDMPEVIAYARKVSQNPSALAHEPDFASVQPTNATAPAAPLAMDTGLIAGDPMIKEVQASAEPGKVLDVLASVGYAAAPNLSAALVTLSTQDKKLEIVCAADQAAQQAEYAFFAKTYTSGTCIFNWGCSCPTTTTVSIGAWTLISSTPNTAGRLCLYTATETTTVSEFGQHFWSCLACISSTSTTRTLYGWIQFTNDSASCPSYPAGSSPPSTSPNDPRVTQ